MRRLRFLMSSLVVLAISVVYRPCWAQFYSYKPVQFYTGFGVALPKGQGSKVGGGLTLEPRFTLTPHLNAALHFSAVYTSRVTTTDTYFLNATYGCFSYLVAADYVFFNENDFSEYPIKFFTGLGLGFTSVVGGETKTLLNSANVANQSYFSGIAGGKVITSNSLSVVPRLGFEMGHFRVSCEYYLINDAPEASYFIAHFGICFGGGRIKHLL